MIKTILLVDDEQIVRDVVSEMLELEGYRVEVRENGIAALKAFNEDPARFDLVLTDHLMTELPGLRLAEEIFKIRPDIPIILFTGGDASVESEAKVIGIQAVIRKPIAMEPLIEQVRKALCL